MPEAFFLFVMVIFQEKDMWKLVVGFIIFAALGLYMLSRGGDIDLGGEKHGAANVPTVVNPVGTPQKFG